MHDTVTQYAAPVAPGPPSPASLVLIHGTAELGKRYPLLGETTLGRDADNDVVLDLPDVSRRHARIAPREGGWGAPTGRWWGARRWRGRWSSPAAA